MIVSDEYWLSLFSRVCTAISEHYANPFNAADMCKVANVTMDEYLYLQQHWDYLAGLASSYNRYTEHTAELFVRATIDLDDPDASEETVSAIVEDDITDAGVEASVVLFSPHRYAERIRDCVGYNVVALNIAEELDEL